MPPSPPPATVLLVDDHPLVRHGLRVLLELQPWVAAVHEAGSIREGAEAAVTHQPSVAVVDLGLPDGDGVTLVRLLRRTVPGCAVLVLTMSSDEGMVRSCLAAGANGYLLKDTPPPAVVNAVRTVADGGLVLGPTVPTGALALARSGALPPPLDGLAPRDVQLLTLLARGSSNSEIAAVLGVSAKTVRNRVSGLLLTLGVADRVQAALLARDKGLLDRR